MTMENVDLVLNRAATILQHQEEIKVLRGENFNIFSILKIENKENETHSAFLGELLNPKGSHLFKNTFLKHFLETINYTGALDLQSASVTLEKHIGSKNDILKTGGRLDIYICDNNGNCISIENKVYANDQNAQIQRYVNHNKPKNRVYYLTLEGSDASIDSKGELREGEDYFCISYKVSILSWLEKCLKESVEQPILRESIKQYIILIKKITNQLTDSKMENEIEELISKNYNTAKIIADNVWRVELNATNKFLFDIKSFIQKELGDDWTVIIDDDLTQAWTGLKITRKDWKGIFVKLEGQSKIPWNNSVYGIHAPTNICDRSLIKSRLSEVKILQDNFRESHAWPYFKFILPFSTSEERARLFNEVEKVNLVKDLSSKLVELAKECEIPLSTL